MSVFWMNATGGIIWAAILVGAVELGLLSPGKAMGIGGVLIIWCLIAEAANTIGRRIDQLEAEIRRLHDAR